MKKLNITKISLEEMLYLEYVMDQYAVILNNNIVFGIGNDLAYIVVQAARTFMLNLRKKTTKQYLPETYTLNLDLHDAHLLFDALLTLNNTHHISERFKMILSQYCVDIENDPTKVLAVQKPSRYQQYLDAQQHDLMQLTEARQKLDFS